jgi:hypothetical protein
MSKEFEESLAIIRPGDYIEELEQAVKLETARIEALGVPRVEKKYKYTEIPDFGDDLTAKKAWELEEFYKCKDGDGGIPGKYYYYLNHTKIKNKAKGKIRPEFRTMDLEWFKFLAKIEKDTGKGIVCVKRRQIGMSIKAAVDMVHDCSFNRDFDIGMNSKTEADSRALFSKVKYCYRNQSDFLRASTSTDRRDALFFARYGKDSFGNKTIIGGTQSSIISVAPVPTAHAGNMYKKLIMDEAGECFSPYFRVLMYDGSVKEIKDISIGEYVMGHDSTPRLVTNVIDGDDEMYEVEGRRGVKFTCNSRHKLALFHSHKGYCELTPLEYLAMEPKEQRYYQLKQTGVEYEKKDYFFDPYWMGLWLGDGSKDKAEIVSIDKEILDYLKNESPIIHNLDYGVYEIPDRNGLTTVNLKSLPVRLEVIEKDGRVEKFKNVNQLCDYYNVSYDSYAQIRGLQTPPVEKPHRGRGYTKIAEHVSEIRDSYINPTTELKKLSLYHNKHIPDCYMKTSREDRLKLLAGLIDSDGYKDSRKDRYEITLSLRRLAEDVHELVKSLGFSSTFILKKGKMKRKDGTVYEYDCYRVSIDGNDLNKIPTRLERKTVKAESVKRKGRRDPLKTGFKITPVGRGKYVGFSLKDNPLFLGHDYLIHHNCQELEAIYANAEDCLIQDGVRCGTIIIFGTMGETDKAGKGLMQFWKNHKMYDLEQFPFWGYHELIMDEFGNDRIEESVRTIIYNRRKREGGSTKIYQKFIQKYPLHEQDAFLSVGGYGIGNPLIIGQQELNLLSEAPQRTVGKMTSVGDTATFIPDPLGQAIIYKFPEKRKDGYTATLDPAEDDDVAKTKDSSELGFSIMSRPFGLMPPEIVAEYCHRPKKLEDAYIQIALLLKLYGCQIHIEMNKGGWRAYDWFMRNFPELLALATRPGNSLRAGVELKHGMKMNSDKKIQMIGLLEMHLDNYCLPMPDIGYKGIPSTKFLAQCKVFGGDGKDDDLAVSVGWNLIIQQSDKKVAKAQDASTEKSQRPRYEYHNGHLAINVNDKNVSRSRNIPRSIFGR